MSSRARQLTKRRFLHRRDFVGLCASVFGAFALIHTLHTTGVGSKCLDGAQQFVHNSYTGLLQYNWRQSAAFRVTDAMKVSIGISLVLGILLGVGVGLLSGLEPAVVIGVSASMAMGCVFVMSFAILHGVNALRAVSFAMFVSVCLPFGFGVGFGVGILCGVFLGLEDPDDIREKTSEFVNHFDEFARVVIAFTLEIL